MGILCVILHNSTHYFLMSANVWSCKFMHSSNLILMSGDSFVRKVIISCKEQSFCFVCVKTGDTKQVLLNIMSSYLQRQDAIRCLTKIFICYAAQRVLFITCASNGCFFQKQRYYSFSCRDKKNVKSLSALLVVKYSVPIMIVNTPTLFMHIQLYLK